MSLTKATYSMISGACLNVFDYMTQSEIADVVAGLLTIDVTSKLQAAFDDATASSKAVYIPSGKYKTIQTLDLTKSITVFGEGMWKSLIVCSGAGVGLKITPPTDRSANTGYNLHDFGIEPAAAGGGTYGIEIVLGVNAFFSNSEIWHVYVGNFGDYGLRLDNSVNNLDGFFTSTFRRNWFHNGVNGDNIGDSLTFAENTVTGTLANKPGFLLKGKSGARQVIIRENNVTTTAGAIHLIEVEQAQVMDNQLEHPASLPYNGNTNAHVALTDCVYCNFLRNTVGTGISGSSTYADYAISLLGTSLFNKLSQNNIENGSVNYISFAALSVNNILSADNSYYFGILPSDVAQTGVVNLGVNNVGVSVSQTLLNGWGQFDASSFVTATRLESAGEVILRGAIAGGTTTTGTALFTLPLGFRPVREKRFPVLTYDGSTYSTAYLSVATSGNVSIIAGAQATLLQIDGIQFTTS